ncbi:MAG: diaminopimelate epimerase [Flavobacterium sp.]|jgi:diaminopimelate epimerase
MKFYKYQGTGNDFIMIDNRTEFFPKQKIQLINQLCDRRFGIGGDGLILLENDSQTDFKMVYYNSDGNQSTMCGNGGRCLVAFAKQLQIIDSETTFTAIDGLHFATIDSQNIVSLQMQNVSQINLQSDYAFLNTGSPHHVQEVQNLEEFDVFNQGKKIRNSDLYGKEGSNINFVNQLSENKFRLRTYERGVEDETLSCGTGATAVAIAMYETNKTRSNNIDLQVQGGNLKVTFTKSENRYEDLFLIGAATFVFEGEIDIKKF